VLLTAPDTDKDELVLDAQHAAAKLNEHAAAARALEADLPAGRVRLGCFAVDPLPVKAALLKLHHDIAEALLVKVRGAIEAQSAAQAKRYGELMKLLTHDPTTIEEVAEIEQLLADLPVRMGNPPRHDPCSFCPTHRPSSPWPHSPWTPPRQGCESCT
jgi:hypothetical protein